MFRRFRHKLLLMLQTAIVVSGIFAWAYDPAAWRPLLICVGGACLATFLCGRLARRYLNVSIGRLRRIADDVGHGRPTGTLEVQPGDDMYKLTAAVNLLASRLEEASREEKRLHEALRRRERLAFLGELAASVAHEVNNPLDGVQNCTRILRRSADDPERTRQMLDLIDSGLERIELIVRRLLTLAREHVVRPSPTRLSAVLESAVESVQPKIDGRRIQLVRDYDTADDHVVVDSPLLAQVFVNLILNAADSMAPGGTLTLRLQRQPAGASTDAAAACNRPDVFLVEVSDTGSGISADVLPHIFEPFFTTKTGGKGTGLGLAIASRIMDAHDGSIEVHNRPAGGTTFRVRIPARPMTAGNAPLAAEISAPAAETAPASE